MRRPSRDEGRAALWALRAAWCCHRQLAAGRVDDVDLPASTRLPVSAGAAVPSVLRRLRCRCLTRSLVLQAWLADHGEPVDVVIGVTSPSTGFAAHAWLDRSRGHEGETLGFAPLHRLAPRPHPR